MPIDILAQKSDVSRDSLMRYEAEKTEPDLTVLNKIAHTLNIESDKLYDEYYKFLAAPYSALIKDMRKRMRLTQKDFGTLLGIHRKTVLRWENGEHVITREAWSQLLVMR